MHYTIDLSTINSNDIFENVINSKKKGDFFLELREIYALKVKKCISASGISVKNIVTHVQRNSSVISISVDPIPSLYGEKYITLDFCAGYDVGERTRECVSYQHGEYNELPTLDTFYKRKNFSIGNFGFTVENEDYSFNVIQSKSVKMIGYTFDISKKKRTSFIAIMGVYFDFESLTPIFNKYHNFPDLKDLIEIRLGVAFYPAIFMCRKTGVFFSCKCFDGKINWEWDFWRFASYYPDEIKERIENMQFIDGICFLCTKQRPKIRKQFTYESGFRNRYAPYIALECKKRNGDIFLLDNKKLENEIREKFGVYKISERWIHETELYNTVCKLYPNLQILFHYRGEEMKGLELDIFIPYHKLGIEYQGIQHFVPIKHWGGKDALEERQEIDLRKKELCKNNGYNLIEFTYEEDINEEQVKFKLKDIIR